MEVWMKNDKTSTAVSRCSRLEGERFSRRGGKFFSERFRLGKAFQTMKRRVFVNEIAGSG
jgi:hypothetical protein